MKKYLYSLALMRYYSLENDIKKTTNLSYFSKKIMLIIYGFQNLKSLKMNTFKYIRYINNEVNKIKKCDLSTYLKDKVFLDSYYFLVGDKASGEN